MSKEKQIEEMAKILAEDCGSCDKCMSCGATTYGIDCTDDVVPKSDYDAVVAGQETLQKALVNAKSEVAREIFWEIDKLLARIIVDDESGEQFVGVDMQKYYALKKKYTEGE